MKYVLVMAAILSLAGCARGKLGRVEQELDRAAVTKTTPIYVETISAKDTVFTGDKANDQGKVLGEKAEIEARYSFMIVDMLKKRGYNAQLAKSPVKKGLVINGSVSKFEHGSGAARYFVGMGAGSSNMFTNFQIEDRSYAKVLSKFEVIATSGARSDVSGFIDAHLSDGAQKVADYIEGTKQ